MDSIPQTDLCIVIDTTGSMGVYIDSLKETIQLTIALFKLTGVFCRLGILSYYDYCDPEVYKWSGWCSTSEELNHLSQFVRSLKAFGGGDIPEAAKTAAHLLLKFTNKTTIVIWYTDAPPHHSLNKSQNYDYEQKILGYHQFDWVNICQNFKDKNIIVYPITHINRFEISSFYVYLATKTAGKVLNLSVVSSPIITNTTINLILGLMNCQFYMDQQISELIYTEPINAKIIKDEYQSGGFLPSTKVKIQIKLIDPIIVPLDFIKVDFHKLINKFATCMTYQATVYKIIHQLLISQINLSKKHNSIFYYFWEQILKTHETSFLYQNTIKTWLETPPPHYKLDEIMMMIEGVENQFPALILKSHEFKYVELFETFKTCQPNLIQKLCYCLSSLKIVNSIDVNQYYIPLDLNHQKLFSFVSHLIVEGTLLPLRPAVIIAILCYVTNNVLKERAINFLNQVKGIWIDDNLSENYHYDFIKLILQAQNFLTEKELRIYTKLKIIKELINYSETQISIIQGFKPFKSIHPDRKTMCLHCHEMRSFTLMGPNGICGLCHSVSKFHIVKLAQASLRAERYEFEGWEKCVSISNYHSVSKSNEMRLAQVSLSNGALRIEGYEKCASISQYHDNMNYKIPEKLDHDRSFWCQCQTCYGHYAIIFIENLNVKPKCHFCRNNLSYKPLVCTKCTNKFVIDPSLKQNDDFFLCPQCEADDQFSFNEKKIPLKILLKNNQEFILNSLEISIPHSFILEQNLFKLKNIIEFEKKIPPSQESTLIYKGKKIINSSSVYDLIKKLVGS
jgi:hypothetical protein